MVTIILLFAVAAVFGLTLLIPVLKGASPSRTFVFVHGGIAAIALVLLLLQFFKTEGTVPVAAVVLFVVAALGGFVLFARDLSKKTIPKGLAVVHAGVAVAGFLILLLSIL